MTKIETSRIIRVYQSRSCDECYNNSQCKVFSAILQDGGTTQSQLRGVRVERHENAETNVEPARHCVQCMCCLFVFIIFTNIEVASFWAVLRSSSSSVSNCSLPESAATLYITERALRNTRGRSLYSSFPQSVFISSIDSSEMSFSSEASVPKQPGSLVDAFQIVDLSARTRSSQKDLFRLIPVSNEAKTLFNSVAWHYLHAHLNNHHRKFLPDLAAYQYDPDEIIDPTKYPFRTQEQAGGFWRIDIEDSTLEDFVWSFGKGNESFGNQEVDVKLGMVLKNQAPDGSFYCGSSMSLAPNHFQIFMHSKSGAFMLEALESLELDKKELRKGKMVALMKPLTLLKTGTCTFWLSFKIDHHLKETDHIRRRNAKLELLGVPIPDTKISGVPMNQDVIIEGRVVFRHGLGYGAFGNVSEGYAPDGTLRAVKRVTVRTEDEREFARNERIALERGQGCLNIVKLYCTFNGRGGKDEGTKSDCALPFEIFFVFEKGRPFYQINFDKFPIKTKIKLARGVIRALSFIHGRSMLHRDLTTQNIIVAGDPVEAKLIDFGKATLHSEADSSYLAAECYLPPEIFVGGRVKYSFELDIHMAGYAMAQSFAQRAFAQGKTSLLPRVRDQWKAIQTAMLSPPYKAHDTADLMRLFIEMMDWDPLKRPSAKTLLARSVFQPAKQIQHKPTESGKRTGSRLDGPARATVSPALPDSRPKA